MICPQESAGNAEYLLDYVAGKLNAETRVQFELHLAACPSCREFAGGQQSVWQALDAFEPAAISPDFDRKLYARIEKQPLSWWKRLTQPIFQHALPIGAVAGVVMMAGIFLSRPPEAPVAPATKVAQVEAVPTEQLENALDDMEMLRDFHRLVVSENHSQQKM